MTEYRKTFSWISFIAPPAAILFLCCSASTSVFRALPGDENVPVVEPDHPPQDPELCTVNTPVRDLQLLDIVAGGKNKLHCIKGERNPALCLP